MRPAFSSTRQAAAFAFLVLLALLLPAVLGKSCLPPREQLYSAASWGLGAFPYIHDQIFEETGEIDIAFMGSSPIWWGIDTRYVEEKLSEKLGRKAVVRTLGWNWVGYDPFYFIAQDLLQRRKVRMIVFCDLSPGAADTAHVQASHWFRFGDNAEALAGLRARSKASFYASAILGLPRNLLSLLRPNLPVIPSDTISWPGFSRVANPAARLGALAMRLSADGVFADYAPPSSADASGVRIYSEATKGDFHFSGRMPAQMQVAFMRKVAALARAQHVQLVYLHMPKVAELKSSVIEEGAFWPDTFQGDVTMVGIPGATLFAGLSEAEVRKLYFDFQHFNENGQKYFTTLITPSLLQVYEKQTGP